MDVLQSEARNVVMHRAHKLAYQRLDEEMFADGSMLEDGPELQDILDHLRYRGWERERFVDIWQRLWMR